ncbi:MAG: glycosyltransferase family 2 protein [Bacteroidales bacterium]|jgi:glycosyltransferase involved in cell wall biosynthesis|nr:glycosyltransferase family 2 protein [Bacteroidales bacterium]MDD2771383.1 glycosyltransferase family 2 protein [Bacteroidales bacterium]MDD3105460.1 glycosyltransferase family 2 protein [Bacteroidales bacterium]MDD3550051.1 glycosyltransferase family 2 protein [Bacteroidales bacterium]MDD4064869.1 glycosyltransferase family 2 protein [Bacteroidales bacterium]
MDLSVVIALYNERDSLPELLERIRTVLDSPLVENTKELPLYEVIFVDDGSTDGSWDFISDQASKDSRVHGIRFRRNYGKSAALYCGFEAARGNVVITMDADLQDDPAEIPALYNMVTSGNYDLVSGWKKKRKDGLFSKTIPSRLYNATARMVTGIKLHDMNCGLKAYKGEVVKSIEVYGEMHRYIPYLAKQAGFSKIGEKPVVHSRRKYGKSKFGLSRFVNGYLDLLSLWFLARFGKRPMHIFGLFGSLMFIAGGVIAVWLIIQKLYWQTHGFPYRQVTDQPLFYLALLAIVLGMQLFLAGFLGELISRNATERNHYHISERR